MAAAERDSWVPSSLDLPVDDPAYSNNISSVFAALTINSIIGGACIAGFLVFRTFMPTYSLRAHLSHVTIKPPPLQRFGRGRVFGWLRTVLRTSDVWLLHSAGLDALVQLKVLALCVQLCIPFAVVGCCMLLPLQISEAYEDGDSTFSRLTMANIDPASRLMWAHWACVFVFLGWTLLLLEWHMREFVTLRNFYLRGGDGFNYWRELHMAEADGVGVHSPSRFASIVETARMDRLIRMVEEDEEEQDRGRPQQAWWRTRLAALTSWTGAGTIDDVERLARKLTEADADNEVIRKLRARTLTEPPCPGASSDAPQPPSPLPRAPSGPSGSGGLAAGPRAEGPARPLGEADEGGSSGGGGAEGARQGTSGGGGRGSDGRRGSGKGESPGSGGGGASGKRTGWFAGWGGRGRKAKAPDTYAAAAAGDDPEAPPPRAPSVNLAGMVQAPGTGGAAPLPPKGAATDEVAFMAAPKWWSTVDVVAVRDGKLRRMTDEEKEGMRGSHILLAKPSVRYRKTVNTLDHGGRPTAVHAQQYAVLVTNVNHHVYPEFCPAPARRMGAGPCGRPRVRYGDDAWLGLRYRRIANALRDDPTLSRTVSVIGGKAAAAALSAAEAVAALEGGARAPGSAACSRPFLRGGARSSGGGAPPPALRGRAAQLWAAARGAMRDGRLRKLQANEDYCVVSAVFASLFPGDFDRAVPVFNHRECDMLMRRWDAALGRLEAAEHDLRLGGARRTTKPRGHAKRVDLIEWLTHEVARLEALVLEARERALVYNSTPSFFALFRTQKAAAIAASCNIHALRKQLFKVHPAPGPEEVNWQSLWFTSRQRALRGFLVTPFIVGVVILPVSMVGSAISQLNDSFCSDKNKTLIQWDDYCANAHPVYGVMKALLTGVVPAMLVLLWQGLLMPRLVFFAAQSEGRHYSLSALDRRMGSIYFLWSAFNFFGGGVVGSTALARLPAFFNRPFETPQLLGWALPASAKFFFVYLILRTFMTLPLRFLLPHPGVWQAWMRMLLSPLARRMRDEGAAERTRYLRNAIRSPRYGVEFGGDTCLILLVAFAFAVICPLIPLFAAVYFAGAWLFWRCQHVYNLQRKYESGGQFFAFFAYRLLVCAAIMVAFTGCVLIIKRAWAQASLLWVIGEITIYAYYKRMEELYVPRMREMPLLVAQMAPRARVPSTVYVPPPLQQNGFLWEPEFAAPWAHCGMPSYSA